MWKIKDQSGPDAEKKRILNEFVHNQTDLASSLNMERQSPRTDRHFLRTSRLRGSVTRTPRTTMKRTKNDDQETSQARATSRSTIPDAFVSTNPTGIFQAAHEKQDDDSDFALDLK